MQRPHRWAPQRWVTTVQRWGSKGCIWILQMLQFFWTAIFHKLLGKWWWWLMVVFLWLAAQEKSIWNIIEPIPSSIFSVVSGFFVDQFLSRSLRMSTWDGVFDGCPPYITITGEGSTFLSPSWWCLKSPQKGHIANAVGVIQNSEDTVDVRNPAPLVMYETLQIMW